MFSLLPNRIVQSVGTKYNPMYWYAINCYTVTIINYWYNESAQICVLLGAQPNWCNPELHVCVLCRIYSLYQFGWRSQDSHPCGIWIRVHDIVGMVYNLRLHVDCLQRLQSLLEFHIRQGKRASPNRLSQGHDCDISMHCLCSSQTPLQI